MASDGDLALDDTTGDLLVMAGDLVIARGTDSIRSDLQARLKFFRGEWFLDTTVGVPYWQSVLVKNPDLRAVREALRSEILGTPGIASLESLVFDYQAGTRQLVVSFQASADSGELVTDTVEVTL